jgi:hypothetical protein
MKEFGIIKETFDIAARVDNAIVDAAAAKAGIR